MPWHTPERKSEQALKLYFQTVLGFELSGVQIVTRFCNTTLTEPRIEIASRSARPGEEGANPYSGNWMVDVTLKIVSHYADGVDGTAHDNIVGNLIDKLTIIDENGNDASATEINATQFESDVQILQVEMGERTCDVEDNSLVTEQELRLYVKPSNIGAS